MDHHLFYEYPELSQGGEDEHIIRLSDQQAARIQNELYAYACELRRPCHLLKPRIFIDGDMWCALYGENLQDGVAGFGKSPELAYWDFDKKWCEKLSESPGYITTKICPACGWNLPSDTISHKCISKNGGALG
ncbi:MAG: hypothetical protein ABSG90_11755 [Dehalococcoidia bacterium]|jgi:hypothetical protein